MTDICDDKIFRLECLKLAQDAEGQDTPRTTAVLDRADEYAVFVCDCDEIDTEDWLEELAAEMTSTAMETTDVPIQQEGSGWDFSMALEFLKNGQRVYRSGWNGRGMYLGLQVPDAGSMNTLPYIYIIVVDGNRVPWLASQADLLADDWYLVQ